MSALTIVSWGQRGSMVNFAPFLHQEMVWGPEFSSHSIVHLKLNKKKLKLEWSVSRFQVAGHKLKCLSIRIISKSGTSFYRCLFELRTYLWNVILQAPIFLQLNQVPNHFTQDDTYLRTNSIKSWLGEFWIHNCKRKHFRFNYHFFVFCSIFGLFGHFLLFAIWAFQIFDHYALPLSWPSLLWPHPRPHPRLHYYQGPLQNPSSNWWP